MKPSNEQVIKSLKTCIDRSCECKDCIHSEKSFDKCYISLCIDALRVIRDLSNENKDLKLELEEVNDWISQLPKCIGGLNYGN